jgi:hypothetical protein
MEEKEKNAGALDTTAKPKFNLK